MLSCMRARHDIVPPRPSHAGEQRGNTFDPKGDDAFKYARDVHSLLLAEKGYWIDLDALSPYRVQTPAGEATAVPLPDATRYGCNEEICLGGESEMCSVGNLNCCREHHQPGSQPLGWQQTRLGEALIRKRCFI